MQLTNNQKNIIAFISGIVLCYFINYLIARKSTEETYGENNKLDKQDKQDKTIKNNPILANEGCQKYNTTFSEYNNLVKSNNWPIIMPYDIFVHQQEKQNKPIDLNIKHTEDQSWKMQYLSKIYPLITNSTIQDFDKLEMYFTQLLPTEFIEKHAPTTYKALLPGPSCNQLPCGCDENGIPNATFDPDPILQGKWPPCNVKGPNGAECCKSQATYKKCYTDSKITWAGGDTWTGNKDNIEQAPPKLNQLWKPSLWPNFTIAVNKYPPNNWNDFYGAKGKPDDTWVEITNSGFAPGATTYGVWFYQTIGSGIFVNVGKTIVGLNKLDIIFKTGFTAEMLSDFILRDYADSPLKIDPMKTGLGGLKSLDYWLPGQYHTNLGEMFANRKLSSDDLPSILKKAAYDNDYKLNRLVNTGVLDLLMTHLLMKNGYNSAQMTCQPNLYNGWAVEIIVVGQNRSTPYTDILQIPRDQIMIKDPNNIETDGKHCSFKTPYTCLYCEGLTPNDAICKTDITPYLKCPHI